MKISEICSDYAYLAGNPLYIWCALELKRYFDIEEPLGPDNAEEIYRRTNQRIRELHMTPGWCLEQSGVELLSTTEDPADSLEYHMKIKENAVLKTRILTAFSLTGHFTASGRHFWII